MFFNPLFIEKSSNTGSAQLVAKNSRIASANYLFTDIINVLANNLSLSDLKTVNENSNNKEQAIELNLLQTAEIDIKNYKANDVKKFIEELISILSDKQLDYNTNLQEFKVTTKKLESLLSNILSQIKFVDNNTNSEHLNEAKIFDILNNNNGVLIAFNQPQSISTFQIVKDNQNLNNDKPLFEIDSNDYVVLYKSKKLEEDLPEDKLGLTFAYTAISNNIAINEIENTNNEVKNFNSNGETKQNVSFYSYPKSELKNETVIVNDYNLLNELNNISQKNNITQQVASNNLNSEVLKQPIYNEPEDPKTVNSNIIDVDEKLQNNLINTKVNLTDNLQNNSVITNVKNEVKENGNLIQENVVNKITNNLPNDNNVDVKEIIADVKKATIEINKQEIVNTIKSNNESVTKNDLSEVNISNLKNDIGKPKNTEALNNDKIDSKTTNEKQSPVVNKYTDNINSASNYAKENITDNININENKKVNVEGNSYTNSKVTEEKINATKENINEGVKYNKTDINVKLNVIDNKTINNKGNILTNNETDLNVKEDINKNNLNINQETIGEKTKTLYVGSNNQNLEHSNILTKDLPKVKNENLNENGKAVVKENKINDNVNTDIKDKPNVKVEEPIFNKEINKNNQQILNKENSEIKVTLNNKVEKELVTETSNTIKKENVEFTDKPNVKVEEPIFNKEINKNNQQILNKENSEIKVTLNNKAEKELVTETSNTIKKENVDVTEKPSVKVEEPIIKKEINENSKTVLDKENYEIKAAPNNKVEKNLVIETSNTNKKESANINLENKDNTIINKENGLKTNEENKTSTILNNKNNEVKITENRVLDKNIKTEAVNKTNDQEKVNVNKNEIIIKSNEVFEVKETTKKESINNTPKLETKDNIITEEKRNVVNKDVVASENLNHKKTIDKTEEPKIEINTKDVKETTLTKEVKSEPEGKKVENTVKEKPIIEDEFKTVLKKEVTSFVLHPNKKVNKENVNSETDTKLKAKEEIKQSNDKPIENQTIVKNGNAKELNNLEKEVAVNDVKAENKPKSEIKEPNKESSKNIEIVKNNISEAQSNKDATVINKEEKTITIKVKKTVKDVTEQKQEQVKPETNIENKTKPTEVNKQGINTEKNININENTKQNSGNNLDFREHKENNTINVKGVEIDNVKSGKSFEDALLRTDNSRNVKLTEVIKEVERYLEKHDKNGLTINIEPEDMGKVKISVEVNDKLIKANITVETEVVKNMLESKLGDLQNNLTRNNNQQGLINISLQNNENKNSERQTGKRKVNVENKTVKEVENEPKESKKSLGYNTVEYIA